MNYGALLQETIKNMGYYIDVKEINVEIIDAEEALRALKDCYSISIVAWEQSIANAKTIDEALTKMRWFTENNRIQRFTGEKLGDDFQIFEVIGPYVKSGSYIQIVGEDGFAWEWYFNGTKVTEINIRWPHDELQY
jgi:hypothetical protein